MRQSTAVGIRRIAVFHQNDSHGKASLEGVTRALKPLGLALADLGMVERNTVEVDAAVKSIVLVSAYKVCAAFIRAPRKAGFGGTFCNVSFVGTRAVLGEKFKPNCGSTEGVVAARTVAEVLRRCGLSSGRRTR